MARSLSVLKGAVEEDLGDVKELIPSGVIERSLNEGQRRYAPEILVEKTVPVILAAGATQLIVPADLYEITAYQSDDAHRCNPLPAHRIHGGVAYFTYPLAQDVVGTLFYRALPPRITPSQPCLLPEVACDGLISFALYKCYKRIASSRSDYRRYSTLVNNATSVADLESLAEGHLQDWQDAKLASPLPQPETFYQ